MATADSLARAAGSPSTIEIDGETLVLGKFALEDWGAAENYLLERDQDRMVGIVARQRNILPDEIWQQKFDEAVTRASRIIAISPERVAEWIDTDDALAWMLWWMLEKTNPGKVTLRKMQSVIRSIRVNRELQRLERLKRARDRSAAIDEASKNSIGPTDTAAVGQEKTAEQANAETNAAAGGISSTSSPSPNGQADAACP